MKSFICRNFSNIKGTFPGSLITGIVLCLAFFVFGFLINGKRSDPAVIRTLIKLISVFSIGFFLAHYLNCMIDRPGYSLLIIEGNEAGFMKWYELPKGGKLLMSLPDLITSHQGSFVSSHALYSVLFIVIFPAYSLVFPSLEKHGNLLMTIESRRNEELMLISACFLCVRFRFN